MTEPETEKNEIRQGFVDEIESEGLPVYVEGREPPPDIEAAEETRQLLSESDFAPLEKWLTTEPPGRRYIIEDLIAEDITVCMNSPGGVGKSNLIFLICACVAAGLNIDPFKVNRPRRVLLVNVEDGQADLWRRFYALGKVYPAVLDNSHLLRENLFVYPGRGMVSPFMYLQHNRPIISRDGIWIVDSMLALKPEFAVFDTKSRLYGLDENSNDHAAQWWRLFENVISRLDNGLTAMVASHSGKQRAGQATQYSNRGAGAFIDNARLNLVLTAMDDKEAELHDVSPNEFFAMSAPKSNYTAIKGKTWFRRSPREGIPVYDNLAASRFFGAVKLLVEMVKELPDQKIKKRELEYRAGGAQIRAAIKDEFDYGKSEFKQVVAAAVQDEKLVLVESEKGIFLEGWKFD